jgi:hypothetical protein
VIGGIEYPGEAALAAMKADLKGHDRLSRGQIKQLGKRSWWFIARLHDELISRPKGSRAGYVSVPSLLKRLADEYDKHTLQQTPR